MSTIWERRDCVSAQVEDSLVLLDLETLVYHSLNPTAAAVWEMLAEPQSASSVVASLCATYQVSPEHCSESVNKLLEQFQASKLVTPKPSH